MATRGTQGHGEMEAALDLAHDDMVSVLRISDFGTKGLDRKRIGERANLAA